MEHKWLVIVVFLFMLTFPMASMASVTPQIGDEPVVQILTLVDRTDLVTNQSGKSTPIYSTSAGAISADLLTLSPDKRHLAFMETMDFSTNVSKLMLIHLPDNRVTELAVPANNGMPTNPIWSPDGEKLAYIWKNPPPDGMELRVLDITTDQTTQILGAESFSIELVYGKTHSLAWEPQSDALQFVHQHNRRTYRVALGGHYEAITQEKTVPSIAEYLRVMRLGTTSPMYDGMVKPLNIRDYDGTCGDGYTGLYPDYGGCVLSGPHPAVDMAWGSSYVGCGTPVEAICTGPIIRVETYQLPAGVSVCGDNTQTPYKGKMNLGWQIVLRCDDVPNATLNGVTYGGTAYAVYAHLSQITPGLDWGVWVNKGYKLGEVGSTGASSAPHLHFQLEKNVSGLDIDHPVYPKTYPEIDAYTWNPMYFIQAHRTTPPANEVIVNPPAIIPATGTCANGWQQFAGYGGQAAYTTSNAQFASQSTNYATWTPNLTVAGNYRIEAYIAYHTTSFCGQSVTWDTSNARYEITFGSNQQTTVVRDQAPVNNNWIDLGTYACPAGTTCKVKLTDLTWESYLSRTINFSAMRFTLLSTPITDTPTPSPTASNTPTKTRTMTPSPSATSTQTRTPTPTATRSVTPTPTGTRVVTPTPTATSTPTSTSIPGTARVGIAPAIKRVNVSTGAFTVDLAIEGSVNLAAFQTDIFYDPSIVHVASVQLGPFLSSSGRTVVPVGPTIDNSIGKVTFGAYSFGSQVGASGAGTLATITFQTRAVGATDLRLQNLGLADPSSNAISATITHGRVQVTQCFGDFDGDNDIDIFDLQRAAGHWNCRTGMACYDPQFDTEPDGDIDVFDLQRVAAVWGTTCPAIVGQTELKQGEDTAIQPGATIATRLDLLPVSRRAAPSAVFTQTLRLQQAINLGAFQAAVRYDPVVVQVESVAIGPFLGSNGLTVIPVGPAIDNSAGRVTFGAFTYGGQSGASGAGDLAYIRFKAQANGDTAVTFEEAGLSDPQGNPLSIGSQTGAQVSVGAQARIYLPLVLR